MSKNPDYICYVADIENTICGWLKLTDNKSENRFYLSSIYVLPEFQKMKIGEKLYHVACEEAVKKGFTEIYIGVMVQNKGALQWYRKLGFTFFEEQPFTMGTTSVPHLIGRKILDK
jgi:ribosomal protein S18 acetylase RimI-like enzyme